jgi:hypothetical protein
VIRCVDAGGESCSRNANRREANTNAGRAGGSRRDFVPRWRYIAYRRQLADSAGIVDCSLLNVVITSPLRVRVLTSSLQPSSMMTSILTRLFLHSPLRKTFCVKLCRSSTTPRPGVASLFGETDAREIFFFFLLFVTCFLPPCPNSSPSVPAPRIFVQCICCAPLSCFFPLRRASRSTTPLIGFVLVRLTGVGCTWTSGLRC